MPRRRFSQQIIRLCAQKRMGKHSATTSARLFDSAVVPLFCQQDMHRNSVQKCMSGLWMARRFLDGMRTGSPRSRTLAIQLQLRLSQRARTTEDCGENGLDGGTCAPTMGDSAGAFLQHTLFFHTIGHLMRFGGERRRLLTVKNLLMAPGGPRWGCDVGCTCNRGGIGRRAWSAAPGTPSRQISCHLLSQEEEPLAMPRVRCNLLMTKPFAPALPAGMACALSESGDRTESREGADAVIEAPCDTSRRVPRWTGGHRCTARELAPWNGGCKGGRHGQQCSVCRCRSIIQGGPPRRVLL